jgi:GTP-binding protein
MFVDEAEIYVAAGKGGDGCLSFRREKFEDLGGPDGGCGGNGGDVILRAAPHVDTLLDFKGKHHWRAAKGMPGAGKDRTGANGEDLTIELPVGTVVHDRDTGVMLKDLAKVGDTCRIARGGKGGRGNKSFATATQQAPRDFEYGEPGEERNLRLELKLIADVGLVGLPNAGKSTLLSRITQARPKIASYPFTTLRPQLGIAEFGPGRRVVIADIPGLIAGAHQGAGLGDAFLRHIERTRIIVHLVDVCPVDEASPVAAYHTIREELGEHSAELAAKPEIVAANKLDLSPDDGALRAFADTLGKPVIGISAATGQGLDALAEAIWKQLDKPAEEETRQFDLPTPPHLRSGHDS